MTESFILMALGIGIGYSIILWQHRSRATTVQRLSSSVGSAAGDPVGPPRQFRVQSEPHRHGVPSTSGRTDLRPSVGEAGSSDVATLNFSRRIHDDLGRLFPYAGERR